MEKRRSIESLVRSRRIRVALAAGLAATGAWAFAPYALSEVGGEAYVNAPLIRLASPIAGTVAADLPEAGSYVAAARMLHLVEARGLDTSALGALLGQQAAFTAELALARRQLGELDTADRRLAVRSNAYRRAEHRRLVDDAAAAAADAAACRPEAHAAALQQARVVVLATRGFAANATVERAAATAATTHARCMAMDTRAAAATGDARAARSGIFLANGSSDTPYPDQQRDRLLLRRQELETIAVNARARLDELDARIAGERLRLAKAAAFAALLPAASVVWSVDASPGTSVVPGTALIDLADCTRRFVAVTLPERRMESIVPGQPVAVRLIGGDAWAEGKVVRAAGAAARRDVAMVAATEADRDPRGLTVEIALPAASPAAAARRCDIGRLAEVRFPRWRG